jgi:spore maturation protein CgeB
MKRILLVDYPYPDGQAREKALRGMGFDIKVFNLIKSRIWPGQRPLKRKAKPFINLIRPLKDLLWGLDKTILNRELLDTVKEFRPHGIFIIKGDNIEIGTLNKMKKICSPLMINWDADSFLSPGRISFVLPRLGLYDYYFTIDEVELLPGVIREGIFRKNRNIFTVPFAANSDYYRPVEVSENVSNTLASSLVFIGTITPTRRSLLENLEDMNLKIWAPAESSLGKWLEAGSILKKNYQNGCVYGEELIKLNSGIVLDINFLFSQMPEIPNVTLRVFEVPAAGGFVLTNYSPQLPNLFKLDEEIICYKSAGECRDKAFYYLKNPGLRKKIAAKGRERVLREHTFENRLKTILGITSFNA